VFVQRSYLDGAGDKSGDKESLSLACTFFIVHEESSCLKAMKYDKEKFANDDDF
jgi:hypothetical protein